jgi:hypothetical protein
MARLGLALCAALVLALPAAQAQASASCAVRGSKTIAKNPTARLYSLRGNLMACVRATGRKRLVAESYDDDYVSSGGWSNTRLAGHFAGFVFSATDISCKAACPPDYEPTTVRTVAYDIESGRATAVMGGDLGRYVLTARGALAWVDGSDLKANMAGTTSVLDSGAIDPGSLRARSNLVFWTRDGVRRFAEP